MIFVTSVIYVSQHSHLLVDDNYFSSYYFKSELSRFANAFHALTFEVPSLEVAREEIEVSSSEVEAVRYQLKSQDYSLELENWFNVSGHEHATSTLDEITDEEIIKYIQYQTYENNKHELNAMSLNFEYEQMSHFYYSITDEFGVNYNNLTELSDTTTYQFQISHDLMNLYQTSSNSRQDEVKFSGTVYVPSVSDYGKEYIMSQYFDYSKQVLVTYLHLTAALLTGIYLIIIRKKIKLDAVAQLAVVKSLEPHYIKLPIEIRMLLFIAATWFVLTNSVVFNFYHVNSLLDLLLPIFSLACYAIAILFVMAQIPVIMRYIKYPEQFKCQWRQGLYCSNVDEFMYRFRHHKLYHHLFLKLLLFTAVIGAWGVFIGLFFNIFVLLASFIVAVLLVIVFHKKTSELQKVVQFSGQLANGEKPADLIVKQPGLLQRIANDLNTIAAGVVLTEKKQSQSERLKTELVTNVSHDLRTPLTSILNYVDLARREDITEDERQQYLHVLDQKSKRLKVLIDDLFEVSKMGSGAVELQKTTIDLVSLLTQSLDEYDEQFKASQLLIRTSVTDEKVMATVDARKLFRVFENLFSNVCKYSHPNTRVYIELQDLGEHAEFSIKNISQYELGFDLTELEERFKRGDTSRHTEGSGLGLAIVKSILDLHQATLSLEQEADLFKVTIMLPKS